MTEENNKSNAPETIAVRHCPPTVRRFRDVDEVNVVEVVFRVIADVEGNTYESPPPVVRVGVEQGSLTADFYRPLRLENDCAARTEDGFPDVEREHADCEYSLDQDLVNSAVFVTADPALSRLTEDILAHAEVMGRTRGFTQDERDFVLRNLCAACIMYRSEFHKDNASVRGRQWQKGATEIASTLEVQQPEPELAA